MSTRAMEPSELPSGLIDMVRRSTARLTDTLHALHPSDVGAPSRLPGWSRGHVLTHLANNAEGLTRLILGSQSGRSLPMYASVEGRNADIAAGATRPGGVIVAHADLANSTLAAAITSVSDWEASTVFATVTGPTERPMTDVLRMRLREVVIHHVDVAASHRFDDEDPDVIRELVRDAAGRFSPKSTNAVDLQIDGAAVATITSEVSTEPPVVVDLDGGTMLGWLTGRCDSRSDLPELPPWG